MSYHFINRNTLLLPLVSMCSVCSSYASGFAPDLTLANEYHAGITLADYWVSEKYDGIRALWTGTELISRHGNVIHAPEWFIQSLPLHQMVEGELWAGRGGFYEVQRIVLDEKPDEEAWRNIQWMVFDMPMQQGDYISRFAALNHWAHSLKLPFIHVVAYGKFSNETQLMHHLHMVEQDGGEGIMLRRTQDSYQSGRSDSLLKLKSYQDAEATVIGYKPGKGRLQGKIGSLQVRTKDGMTFYLGSGLSDEERLVPPDIGSQITYRYNGLTSKGKPRFARFLRINVAGY